MATQANVKTDDLQICEAIRSRFDALVAARNRLREEVGQVDRDIRACRSAARAFNIALPNEDVCERSTVSSIILEMLREAGTAGATVTALRPAVEHAYGDDLHPKSIGVALLRMSKKGLARRERRRWFAA